jgi:acetyl coenzyme A synthetase (ADP forming)-like protein
VVGASRRKDSIGYAILHNLLLGEFQGPIYPVNPKARVIHSLRCYPSVEAVPDPVDLAVIVVPKHLVAEAVESSLAHGVKGLVVITAGFAETGPEGAAAEKALRDRVREAGARMVGPNCMGVINTETDIQLEATFAPTPAEAGSIGFVSQSGALGVAILNQAHTLGIGFTQFVSVGNRADVSGNDLLARWENDESTRVVAMYLESFGNPRHFTEIARRVTRKKPVLVVKSGRTVEGARAASSHTGSLAGRDITVSAFLEQCGVIRANSIEEMFDIAMALDRCPLPPGDRVAVVTNAGGPGIMATDACVNLGLTMATLASGTEETLRGFLPPEASLVNPVDMIASAGAPAYAMGVAAVLEDPGVDMVLVIHVRPLPVNPADVLESIHEAAKTRPDKPVVAVIMAPEEFRDELRGRSTPVPVYRFPESAALALSKLSAHAEWRRRPEDSEIPRFEVDREAAAKELASVTDGYLPSAAAFRVLEAYGIPVVSGTMVPDAKAARDAAVELGFPVVVKAEVSGMIHKSDLGAVAVDLRTPEELARALDAMTEDMDRAGLSVEGFLVQQFAAGGHEVIYGLSQDGRFGPLLMFGLGGKYVEVFGDVRFALPPLTRSEALEVVMGIRGRKILEGVRGEKALDPEFLAEILLRLAQLTEDHPGIRELDINPFLAAPTREACKALDVRIRVGSMDLEGSQS